MGRKTGQEQPLLALSQLNLRMTSFTSLARPLLRSTASPRTALPRLILRPLNSRLSSTQSTTYPGLYYHKLQASDSSNPQFQLSFLPDPAPNPAFSPTTIGTFSPPKDQLAKLQPGQLPEVSPRGFEENPLFVEVLHTVLSEGVKVDQEYETMAVVRGDGYMSAPFQLSSTLLPAS